MLLKERFWHLFSTEFCEHYTNMYLYTKASVCSFTKKGCHCSCFNVNSIKLTEYFFTQHVRATVSGKTRYLGKLGEKQANGKKVV